MVVCRDEGQLMPTAAQAALSWVPATSWPSLPAQHTEAWLRLKERAAISSDKKCHPSLGNITRPIRISIKSKHMAGCRTELGGAG